jgi:hypothetical protein
MAKLDEFASLQRPHAPHSGWHLRSWLAGHWDLLVLLLFVFDSTDPVWLSPRVPPLVRDTTYADDSWHLDQVFKLSRGIWVGRDVAFTHGPIFQALSSAPARFMGVSMGTIYATWVAVPAWCAFVFVYLTLRLLLAGQPAWKRALLLFLVLMFWLVYWAWSLQSAFPLLLFAIFLRGWYAVAGRAQSCVLGIVAALLCVTAFLIASDTGVYSVAAWAIATAAVAFENSRDKHVVGKCMAALLAYAGSGLVFALAVNLAMGGLFDFRFWKDSAQIVNVYRWATATAMTDAGTVHLLGTLLTGAAVFLFRAGAFRAGDRSKQNPAIPERTGFLLGGFAFAVVMLQSALVRSDVWHVQNGSFAMVLFAGVILFSFQSAGTSSAAILLAIVCSLLSGQRAFGSGTVTRLVQQLRRPPNQCPAGFSEFDRGCFVPEFAAMLQSATSYLGQHSEPQEDILVFPYQTMFGIASRRSVAGGLMQAYTASGPHLSQLEITGLESAAPPAGLYVTDLEWRGGHSWLSETDQARWHNLGLSFPFDGIYNFTRAPEVWFWMLRHYHSEGGRAEGAALSDGIFGLLRDDARPARISMQAQPLGLAAQTSPIHERSSAVDLGAPDWPADADFLRLRLTVRYGVWWKLRKPERLQLEITRADGSSDSRCFIAQPNVSNEVWLYPWSQGDLANYLAADEGRWRTTPRPAITRLRMVVTPLDWVSVAPDAIVLEAADAVRISMHP